jgi:predicted N-acetyltransferase YhbS
MTTALVRTRQATEDDVAAVLALHERCSAQTLEQRFHAAVPGISLRLARRLVLPPGGWSIVAEQCGQVVGHGCAGPLSDTEVEVGLLVDDAFQGSGIGSRLIRDLAGGAAERGFRALVCEVEPDNESVLPTVHKAGLRADTAYVDGVLEIVVPLAQVVACDQQTA